MKSPKIPFAERGLYGLGSSQIYLAEKSLFQINLELPTNLQNLDFYLVVAPFTSKIVVLKERVLTFSSFARRLEAAKYFGTTTLSGKELFPFSVQQSPFLSSGYAAVRLPYHWYQ